MLLMGNRCLYLPHALSAAEKLLCIVHSHAALRPARHSRFGTNQCCSRVCIMGPAVRPDTSRTLYPTGTAPYVPLTSFSGIPVRTAEAPVAHFSSADTVYRNRYSQAPAH